jgi:hypothetical protein
MHITEWQFVCANRLGCLVAFSGDNYDVARLCRLESRSDRESTIQLDGHFARNT